MIPDLVIVAVYGLVIAAVYDLVIVMLHSLVIAVVPSWFPAEAKNGRRCGNAALYILFFVAPRNCQVVDCDM